MLHKKYPHERDELVNLHPEYDDNHVYLIRNEPHTELGFKSVTSFIKDLFHEFDADETLDKYYDKWQKDEDSAYFGKTRDEIKTQWIEKGQKASADGTYMHMQFENIFNNLPHKDIPEIENFKKWQEQHRINPYRTEMTIFSDSLKLVGNVDLIAINKSGDFIIVDYKRSDPPNKSTFGKKVKSAALKLPHTAESKHILQLNVYRYILKKEYGINVKGLYNLYIRDTDCQYLNRPIIPNGVLEEIFSSCDS